MTLSDLEDHSHIMLERRIVHTRRIQDKIYRHCCIPGVSAGNSQAGSNIAIT